MSRSRKPHDDDESTLFREAMRGVQPLVEIPVEETPRVAPKARAKVTVRPTADTPAPGKNPVADGSGVQARTLQRLRRGRLRPEATLDLHGFTRNEARIEVDRFLHRSHAMGHRCVLVIHGIGRGSQAHGVLRQALPEWLAAHQEVLTSSVAQPADGGAGASYVLLRRRALAR